MENSYAAANGLQFKCMSCKTFGWETKVVFTGLENAHQCPICGEDRILDVLRVHYRDDGSRVLVGRNTNLFTLTDKWIGWLWKTFFWKPAEAKFGKYVKVAKAGSDPKLKAVWVAMKALVSGKPYSKEEIPEEMAAVLSVAEMCSKTGKLRLWGEVTHPISWDMFIKAKDGNGMFLIVPTRVYPPNRSDWFNTTAAMRKEIFSKCKQRGVECEECSLMGTCGPSLKHFLYDNAELFLETRDPFFVATNGPDGSWWYTTNAEGVWVTHKLSEGGAPGRWDKGSKDEDFEYNADDAEPDNTLYDWEYTVGEDGFVGPWEDKSEEDYSTTGCCVDPDTNYKSEQEFGEVWYPLED